jgi:hypothetical protein
MSVFIQPELIKKLENSELFTGIKDLRGVEKLKNFIDTEILQNSSCACLELIGTHLDALYLNASRTQKTCDYKHELETHLRQCLTECASTEENINSELADFNSAMQKFPALPATQYERKQFEKYTEEVYAYLNENLFTVGPCGCLGTAISRLKKITVDRKADQDFSGVDYQKEIRDPLLTCLHSKQQCNVTVSPPVPSGEPYNYQPYIWVGGGIAVLLVAVIIILCLRLRKPKTDPVPPPS